MRKVGVLTNRVAPDLEALRIPRLPRRDGLGAQLSLPEIRENFYSGLEIGPIGPIISSAINYLR